MRLLKTESIPLAGVGAALGLHWNLPLDEVQASWGG